LAVIEDQYENSGYIFYLFILYMKVYTEQEVKILDDNDEQLKQFHPIHAAGGVVINEKGQLLLIFRRGHWDLPKGKLEDNEPLELCAERESKEETGLKDLVLQKFLLTTYHTYVDKKKLVIKDTHWFLFKTPGVPVLYPQKEEDILKAEWVDEKDLATYTSNAFLLIKEVLKTAGFREEEM
jgi:8-oxo-dGTP pyrophosphatase MutT (NUDIX family)